MKPKFPTFEEILQLESDWNVRLDFNRDDSYNAMCFTHLDTDHGLTETFIPKDTLDHPSEFGRGECSPVQLLAFGKPWCLPSTGHGAVLKFYDVHWAFIHGLEDAFENYWIPDWGDNRDNYEAGYKLGLALRTHVLSRARAALDLVTMEI